MKLDELLLTNKYRISVKRTAHPLILRAKLFRVYWCFAIQLASSTGLTIDEAISDLEKKWQRRETNT